MIKINLLPWREELRKQKQKQFNDSLAIWVMFSGAIFAGIHFYFDAQQTYQTQRNQILENETVALDKKIATIKNIEESKKHLINKIMVVHNLQSSRPETVHLFTEIPRITPDNLFMTKLTRVGRNLTFEGKSQSNALVSALMSAIESSKWLQTPTLNVIQSSDKLPNADKSANEKMQDFTLQTKQRDLPTSDKTS
jgi:type IV pilus assembly protein PilN